MVTIRFTKAEGAQNDFLIVDDMERAIPDDVRRRFAREACHRRRGVGGDGVIFIERCADHDFRMEFYNPDGSHGSMCGNGGRAAALYARTRGIAGPSMRFDALGQSYRAEMLADSIRLFFPPPKEVRVNFSLSDFRMPSPEHETATVLHYADTGAPHLVAILGEESGATYLRELDVESCGRALRMHPAFQPRGTNVNFVAVDPKRELHVRTFEKGVEAETEACGTGAIASAIVACVILSIAPPLALHTHGGDVLRVGFDAPELEVDASKRVDENIDPMLFGNNLYLEGPARLVFEGEYRLD
jgi:diaminopimelate epimerase